MATQIVNLYYTDASVIVEDASRALAPRDVAGGARRSRARGVSLRDGQLRRGAVYSGKTGYGKAGSGQLFGGAEATLAALRDLGYTSPFYLLTVISVATVRGWPVIVTMRPFSDGRGHVRHRPVRRTTSPRRPWRLSTL